MILKRLILFAGGLEIGFLLFIAFLLFGPKKLPEIARTLGKGMAELRRASNELRFSLEEEIRNLDRVDPRADYPTEEYRPEAISSGRTRFPPMATTTQNPPPTNPPAPTMRKSNSTVSRCRSSSTSRSCGSACCTPLCSPDRCGRSSVFDKRTKTMMAGQTAHRHLRAQG